MAGLGVEVRVRVAKVQLLVLDVPGEAQWKLTGDGRSGHNTACPCAEALVGEHCVIDDVIGVPFRLQTRSGFCLEAR